MELLHEVVHQGDGRRLGPVDVVFQMLLGRADLVVVLVIDDGIPIHLQILGGLVLLFLLAVRLLGHLLDFGLRHLLFHLGFEFQKRIDLQLLLDALLETKHGQLEQGREQHLLRALLLLEHESLADFAPWFGIPALPGFWIFLSSGRA